MIPNLSSVCIKHQWRHSESANPGSNAVTLGTKNCKLTRTLRNVTLHSPNVLLWTMKILITSFVNNKFTDVCNLWAISKSWEVQKGFWCFDEQADSSAPSPWASTEPYLQTDLSIFLPKHWWEVVGLCSALAFQTTAHCSAWTELIKS